METFDSIIIGTGIGGAAIGALLAHSGRNVLILDKNTVVGGRCTSYTHKGFSLDLGVHLFGLGENGPLEEVLRRTGMSDTIDWVMVKKSTQQIGTEVKKYSQQNMLNSLPVGEQTNLINLFMKASTITDEEIDELWYTPVKTWIDNFSMHPSIHAFISSMVKEYFCVSSETASTAEFIKCFRDVLATRSTAYPRGGCIAIPQAYLSVLKKHGGKVRLNAEVNKIIVKNGAATGVCLRDGTELHAPVIISNADIKETVDKLIGPQHFSKEYAKKVSSLTYSDSCIMLKVGLKERITDEQLRMYIPEVDALIDKAEKGQNIHAVPEKIPGMIVIPTNFDSLLGPDEDKQLICIGALVKTAKNVRDRDWSVWFNTLRNSLYSAFPEAKNKVLWEKMDTPQLVDAYAGEDGAIVGVGQTVDQIHKQRLSVASPLDGLFFSSAEAGGHGIGTELAASSALELFNILRTQ